MISNAELTRLVNVAKALGHSIECAYDFSEGRCIIEAVTLDGVTLDPISAAERLRPIAGPAPAGEAVSLEWRCEDMRGRPIWRLYAPRAVLAAIGGAPCHVGAMIGTIAREGRTWAARIELTPYHTVTVEGGRASSAMNCANAAIAEHLTGLGFGAVVFEGAA